MDEAIDDWVDALAQDRDVRFPEQVQALIVYNWARLGCDYILAQQGPAAGARLVILLLQLLAGLR